MAKDPMYLVLFEDFNVHIANVKVYLMQLRRACDCPVAHEYVDKIEGELSGNIVRSPVRDDLNKNDKKGKGHNNDDENKV